MKEVDKNTRNGTPRIDSSRIDESPLETRTTPPPQSSERLCQHGGCPWTPENTNRMSQHGIVVGRTLTAASWSETQTRRKAMQRTQLSCVTPAFHDTVAEHCSAFRSRPPKRRPRTEFWCASRAAGVFQSQPFPSKRSPASLWQRPLVLRTWTTLHRRPPTTVSGTCCPPSDIAPSLAISQFNHGFSRQNFWWAPLHAISLSVQLNRCCHRSASSLERQASLSTN